MDTERDRIIAGMSDAELLMYAAIGGKTPRTKALRVLAQLDQVDRERPNMAGRAWRWRAKERAA